jgi:hypothetical protein
LHGVPEPLIEETARTLIGTTSRIDLVQTGKVMTSLEVGSEIIRRWHGCAERIRAEVTCRHVFEQLLIWSGRVMHSPRSHRLIAESRMDTRSRRAGLLAAACLRARIPLTVDLCDRIQEILAGERAAETTDDSLAAGRRCGLANALATFHQGRQTAGGPALLGLLSFFISAPLYPAKNDQALFLAFQIAAGMLGCPPAMPTRELVECFTRRAVPGSCDIADLGGVVGRAMVEAVEAIDLAITTGQGG